MAYDVTALTTAIAEGRIDEAQGKDLITRFRDLEIETAKLLQETPPSDPVIVQEEPAQPVEAQPDVIETPVEPVIEQ